jgi:hypothetical protein
MEDLMKNLIAKIKKERWHLHALIAFIIALAANVLFLSPHPPFYMALGVAFAAFFFSLFWEEYHKKTSNAKFSWSDIAVGTLVAFLFTLIYQLIKQFLF